MKTDTNDIDKGHLARFINAQYGFGVASLTFLPGGEDAYAYYAPSRDGPHYFVRVQPPSRYRALEQAYRATNVLHHRYRLTQVVAPYPTLQDTFTASYDGYMVAIFPFIDGKTLYSQESGGTADTDLAQAATLLAAIHDAALSDVMPLPRETFKNPFKSKIMHALEAADGLAGQANPYRHKVARLLAAQRADVVATLEKMEQFEARAVQMDSRWVLTHGDPNLDNFLKDESGVLHLTDWGEIAMGPAERDLKAFAGARFEVFLGHYAHSRVTKTFELSPDVFAFYFYHWAMQEIADYATRILFENMGPQEDEHAWAELQDYLPIPHDEIAREKRELEKVLGRLLG